MYYVSAGDEVGQAVPNVASEWRLREGWMIFAPLGKRKEKIKLWAWERCRFRITCMMILVRG